MKILLTWFAWEMLRMSGMLIFHLSRTFSPLIFFYLICTITKFVVFRHLLSADTKEERVEWCHQLNKALTVIRAWGKKTDL